MMRRSMVLAGAALFLATAAQAAGVNFSHRFEAGRSDRYRVKMNTDADFRGMTMTQAADMEVTMKCVSVAPDRNVVELTVDKAEMSRSMMGNMESDPTAAKITGRAIGFVVNGKGEVSEINPVGYMEGWDELKRVVEPLVKSMYVYLPGNEVAVGGTWTHERKETEESGVDLSSKGVFKFKEMKKEKGTDCAVVAADIDNKMGGTSTTPMGSFGVDGKGKGKYDFSFDPSSGTVLRFKSRIDIEMNLTPQAGGEPVVSIMGYTIEREKI